MPQTPVTASRRQEACEALNDEDRLWLAERLVEYKEFLEFLRTH